MTCLKPDCTQGSGEGGGEGRRAASPQRHQNRSSNQIRKSESGFFRIRAWPGFGESEEYVFFAAKWVEKAEPPSVSSLVNPLSVALTGSRICQRTLLSEKNNNGQSFPSKRQGGVGKGHSEPSQRGFTSTFSPLILCSRHLF